MTVEKHFKINKNFYDKKTDEYISILNELTTNIDKDVRFVVFDVDTLSFISSSMIGAFISVYIILREKNIKFKIINVNKNLEEVFVQLGLNNMLNIEYKKNQENVKC